MIQDFSGKTAFITGGANGIGLSMAEAFGQAGMNVVLADINQNEAEAAAEKLASKQIKAKAVACDVADRGSVREAALEAIAAFGKIHLACNNAGVAAGGMIGAIEPKHWDWVIDVNIKGVIYGVETFAPLILSHGEGGHIVNTASMAGMIAPPTMEPYSASKFAVVAMTEGWAAQLAPRGVGVSALCPGFVKTRIHESGRTRQDKYGGTEQAPAANDELSQAAAAAVTGGIDVDVIGKRVLEAVKAGELWIFTHPNYKPLAEARFSAILAAFDTAAGSEALKAVKEWPPVGVPL